MYGIETTNRLNYDATIQEKPFNFTSSGWYDCDSGGNGWGAKVNGYYWQPRASSITAARVLFFNSSPLYSQYSNTKGVGETLRCLVPLVSRQLPTYDGTKSYQNLLVGVYGGTYGNLADSHIDTMVYNKPVNFDRGGHYYRGSGYIISRNGSGFYWQTQATTNTYGRYLNFSLSVLTPHPVSDKGYGFSIRCLVR